MRKIPIRVTTPRFELTSQRLKVRGYQLNHRGGRPLGHGIPLVTLKTLVCAWVCVDFFSDENVIVVNLIPRLRSKEVFLSSYEPGILLGSEWETNDSYGTVQIPNEVTVALMTPSVHLGSKTLHEAGDKHNSSDDRTS